MATGGNWHGRERNRWDVGSGGRSTGGAGGSATGGAGTGRVAREARGPAALGPERVAPPEGGGRAGSGGAGGAVTGGAGGREGGGGLARCRAAAVKRPRSRAACTTTESRSPSRRPTCSAAYILNVPTNYDNTKAYKLVIAYHALNSNDHSVYSEKYYDLQPLSNNTTIFVAPNGQQNGAPCSGTGTGDSGCGWPNTSDQDMQLADAVVKQVEDNFCVDTNRIFATGWSYGASMSEQTACERPLGGSQAAGWGVRAIAIYAVAYLSNSSRNARPPSRSRTTPPTELAMAHDYDGTSRCSTSTGTQGGVGVAKDWAATDGCTWQLPTKGPAGLTSAPS